MSLFLLVWFNSQMSIHMILKHTSNFKGFATVFTLMTFRFASVIWSTFPFIPLYFSFLIPF